ncbi:MAG: hypothetical protein WBF94_21095 [Gordonia sp. (in: high G+C Gram-positive bacteria)]
MRNLPAPPPAVFDDLVDPGRQPVRPWLDLLADEVPPTVLVAVPPARVMWATLWPRRPDARIEFFLTPARGGTDLRRRLTADEPLPDDSLTGHLRRRVNELIFARLRYTYGQ